MHHLKPGTLFVFAKEKAQFALVQNNKIQNHLNWSDWFKISRNNVVMFVESFHFSPATAMATRPVTATATAMATETVMASATATGMVTATATARMATDHDEFWRQWNQNKKIAGGIFLAKDKKIWISNIDMKYFERR